MLPIPRELDRALAALKTSGPVIIGIDGRSGAGKSTLAAALARSVGAQVLEGDAFFAGGTGLHPGGPAERAESCIDRPKLRGVLDALRRGEASLYRPFDWEAFDGSFGPARSASPAAVHMLEGVYSCHPDFHDALDLKILVTVDLDTRERRLISREGSLGPWERQWHDAEDWYFDRVMPPSRFDVVI